MSETVVMEFSIDDKQVLQLAVVAIGLEYRAGQRHYITYPESKDCDDAIGLPGNTSAYEIGVIARDGGGWLLEWDHDMAGQLRKVVGSDGERLQQEYNAQFTARQYEQDGFSVTRTVAEDGRILLEATR